MFNLVSCSCLSHSSSFRSKLQLCQDVAQADRWSLDWSLIPSDFLSRCLAKEFRIPSFLQRHDNSYPERTKTCDRPTSTYCAQLRFHIHLKTKTGGSRSTFFLGPFFRKAAQPSSGSPLAPARATFSCSFFSYYVVLEYRCASSVVRSSEGVALVRASVMLRPRPVWLSVVFFAPSRASCMSTGHRHTGPQQYFLCIC